MAAKFPNSNFVPPKLGTSLRLVCGESPGADEEIAMEPFVGGSGRRLDALYRTVNVRREHLTIINTTQCRPPNNVYPLSSEARSYITKSEAEASVRQCYKNHVRPILLSRPWERIDILGGQALHLLTGKDGIFRYRGTPMEVDTDEIDKRLNVEK